MFWVFGKNIMIIVGDLNNNSKNNYSCYNYYNNNYFYCTIYR